MVAVDVGGCCVWLGLDITDGVIAVLVTASSGVNDGIDTVTVGREDCMLHPVRRMANIRSGDIQV